LIDYVFAHNIDDRVLKKAALLLESGGLVAYPTDSSWGIGCSIRSKSGMEKLRKLKNTPVYTPTLLCKDLSQWTEFAVVENPVFKTAKRLLPGPFVFILPTLGSSEKKWGMKRPEVGLRIPDHPIPLALVEALGHPIFSLTASKQMAQPGWWEVSWAEENLFEYGWELEEIDAVDLVLDTGEPLAKVLTTVLDFTSGEPVVLRQGLGDFQ
jgi:tRNA threonylcarbamoyl adenosine modification protein (Sua5/YciO/YrdC/YwlC family)